MQTHSHHHKASFWQNQKGFVGPIGDDLPSLIPLTIALLIFFGGFAFAFNSFEEKKAEFDQRLLLLNIGKILKGDNLLDNFQKWKDACQGLEVTRYQFRAVVFLVSTEPNAAFYNYEFFNDWQEPPGSEPYSGTDDSRIYNFNGTNQLLYCDNEGAHEGISDLSSLEKIYSSKALAQKTLRISFPVAVAVAKDDSFRPAILTVMVWKT